jgi:hypothetical protein
VDWSQAHLAREVKLSGMVEARLSRWRLDAGPGGAGRSGSGRWRGMPARSTRIKYVRAVLRRQDREIVALRRTKQIRRKFSG